VSPARTPSGRKLNLPLIGGAAAAGLAAVVVVGVIVLSGAHPAKPPPAASSAGASAAPTGSAEAVRGAIAASLPNMPCSWLKLESVAPGPTGLAVKLNGITGASEAAQTDISGVVAAQGARAADIDMGDVDLVALPVCSILDAFRGFRADTLAGHQRLSTSQPKYTLAKTPDGALQATAVIDVRIGNPSVDAALLGIDEAGTMQMILQDRKAIAAAVAASQVSALNGDAFRLQIQTTNPGWSGILLLTGRGPFDKALLETPPAKRDDGWIARVRQAQSVGGWQSEMVSYQSVAPAG
jgi:serine/threonine-protein kinase